ncbi:glutathione S-transferase Ure2-like protein [Calycina marina]|uniref:Glutathione S-transferase Ure2-like protein n=1 Tax=Calycina marina TaxID=1763456 RepID=A0A9P8CHE9_9HELO|nr:glutathione S-transferase Ure2-like protein [Calycina marina]
MRSYKGCLRHSEPVMAVTQIMAVTTTKQFVLYGGVLGPNLKKDSYTMRELGVTCKSFPKTKQPAYLLSTKWTDSCHQRPKNWHDALETSAIIEYLIHYYDPDHLILFSSNSKGDFSTREYLFFQVSSQEKLHSDVQSYVEEIKRINGVFDKLLEKKEWLVGRKCTSADLSFLSCQNPTIDNTLKKEDESMEEAFPGVWAWMERMEARKAVREVNELA